MIKINRLLLTVFFITLILPSCNIMNESEKKIVAPVAEIIPQKLAIHGHERIDNYFWMKNRDSEEVINYLNAENDYTKEVLADTEEFQEKLYNEMIGRIKQDDSSVPYRLNGYYYYTRFEEGKEYPLYCRKIDAADATEEVMLNVNQMAEGFPYYQVGGTSVSEDNRILAFSVDTVSRRKYSIYFKDLKTGEIYSDKIDNTSGSITWASDNLTVFFSRKDETLREFQVSSHILGTSVETDKVVYQENDPTFSCSVYKSKSRKYLIIDSESTLSSEYRIMEANNPMGEFRIFQERIEDMLYSISHNGNRFIVKTNLDALNFRLMECPENNTGIKSWKEIVPHREDVLIEDIETFNDYLVIAEKSNALNNIRVILLSSGEDYYIDFDENAYMAYISQNYESDTDVLRYGYTSLTTPSSTCDFNMKTRERTLLKQQEVLGDFIRENYQTERLWAPATDGTSIPISLVYRKDKFKKDGSNPLWIQGYGSYGYSSDPYFTSSRLSLLDRGFVFAIAHIRGGQEMGRQWYEDGKLLNKKNTFTDFIDCTIFLQKNQYSSPSNTVAWGGSAGGLLMGAVISINPDIYNSIIAAVPFVDVITTMLDESIPLTTGEYDEWGNPNEKKYYDFMLSYSPYDQVKEMDYPNILVTTGYHDSQVQYWEPAKWVAKLRALKTDNNLLLLKTNMDFGHGGASGRFEALKEKAMEYAFVIKNLKMVY